MEKAEVFLARAADLPALKAVVVWDPVGDFRTKTVSDVKLMHWSALLELGKGCSDEVLEARKAAQVPGNVCTYIYTSGTTGNPKAVMITHDNIIFIATVILKHFKDSKVLGHEDVEERLISCVYLSPCINSTNKSSFSLVHTIQHLAALTNAPL
jgi:long-subunit acyl-CoA synthetase (AMP-forming)